jgi:hypothetical protein
MSVERQRKIELLVRKNEAKREHPYYLTELSHVLKQPIAQEDLLDLETTDELFSRFNNNTCRTEPESTLKNTWPYEPNSRWLRICFCIAEQLEFEPVALFAGPYDACGAIQTKAYHPLVNAPSVLAFDRDTVRMQSLNSDGGLYLDLYEENSARWIEIKVWGDWCSRAKKCLTQAGVEGKTEH